MQVRLEVAHQKANVKRVVLKQDAVIGRSADCSLRIASSLVSRQHCKFTITEESVQIRDLGSSNGTFVNGTKLAPNQDYEISPDSQLSVGGVMFVVRFDAPVPVSPPPAPLLADPPGSTVDLPAVPRPRREKKSDELTAEWSPDTAAVPAALAETASYSALAKSVAEEKARQAVDGSDGATVTATPEQLADVSPSAPPADPDGETAMGLEDASPIVEDAFVEAAAAETEADVVAELEPVEPADAVPVAEVETLAAPGETETAPPQAVVVDPAMAEQEVVSAHAGDVLDGGLLDSASGGPFAFGEGVAPAQAGWSTGQEFSEAPAGEPETAPAPVEESPKKKKKLFGLFGLFGKKEKPATVPVAPVAAAPLVETQDAASDTAVFTELPAVAEPVVAQAVSVEPIVAAAVEEGAFVTEVVEAVVVEAIPIVGEVEPSAAILAVATAVPAEGVVAVGVEVDPYDTVAVAVPVAAAAVAAPPAASPAPADDDGFGDFLKQIGQ